MRTVLNIFVSEFDHPKVAVEPPYADDDQPWVTIGLSEEVTINGSPEELRRWVQELAVQIAGVGS